MPSPKKPPPGAVQGTRGRASPGGLPPGLTLYSRSQSSSLSCIDSKVLLETIFLRFSAIARFSARPRSGRWVRGGDESVAYSDLGVIWREGCYLAEGLRARPMFPSPPRVGQAGFEKPGVGGEVPRASSAAPHGLRLGDGRPEPGP